MALSRSFGLLALGLSMTLVAFGCGKDQTAKPMDTSAGGGPFGTGGSHSGGGSGGNGATGGSGGEAGGPTVPTVPQLSFASVALPGVTNPTDFAFIPGKPDEF